MWLQSFVEERILDALFIPRFSAVGLRCVAVKSHVLPVAVVPADFFFRRLISPPLFHHDGNLFNGLVPLRLVENVADVRMFLEARMEEFEHMRTDALQVGLVRVLLIKL